MVVFEAFMTFAFSWPAGVEATSGVRKE